MFVRPQESGVSSYMNMLWDESIHPCFFVQVFTSHIVRVCVGFLVQVFTSYIVRVCVGSCILLSIPFEVIRFIWKLDMEWELWLEFLFISLQTEFLHCLRGYKKLHCSFKPCPIKGHATQK